MNKLICLFALFCLNFQAEAQKFSRDYWHQGEIDLGSGETIKGQVKYELERDNLVFQSGNILRSYFAQAVDAWQIVDATNNQIRYFYTLPYSADGPNGYKKPTFFELLVEGNHLTLFSREQIVEKIENVYDPYWFSGRSVRVAVQEENYFFMDKEGNIQDAEDTLDGVLQFMSDQDKALRKFIKTNELKIERRSDMVQIVNYYNSLKN
jgi:hypothetical protein